MSSTPRSFRRRSDPMRRTSCGRRSPACSGPNSSTTMTSIAGCPNAAAIHRPARSGTRRGTTAGSTCRTATSSRCRTSGNTPGTPAWDLAFHVLALTLVDEDFGKQQLDLMLEDRYLHPSGQIPAYEWNFGDVNPPVHAWSTIFTYRLGQVPARSRRRRMARTGISQAVVELHLVGQSQGSRRQQRVRRRLPRPRQHRGVRSQRAAADGRAPRAGRRHGVDGALLPEHARDRGTTGR